MIFGATNVFALTFAIGPRKIDLGDGLVFWLVLPGTESFPEAGLYRDEELIYSVDVNTGWWGWSSLYFSDDAMTFLRVPRIGGGFIRFYDRGVYVHGHGTVGLLRRGAASFMQGWSYYQWDFPEQRYYNRTNNILKVTTVENVIITFDLSTGEIISKEMSWWQRNVPSIIYIGIAAVFAIGLFYWIKDKRSKSYKDYDDWQEW